MSEVIIIEATVNAPAAKVWEYWTGPEHIVNWNAASDDWHTTKATNCKPPVIRTSFEYTNPVYF